MREGREAGQLSDPKPAGRPPLKFPPEIAGPLIRRYLMDQRREGQPVTIGRVLEHLAGLQEPVVVSRECFSWAYYSVQIGPGLRVSRSLGDGVASLCGVIALTNMRSEA